MGYKGMASWGVGNDLGISELGGEFMPSSTPATGAPSFSLIGDAVKPNNAFSLGNTGLTTDLGLSIDALGASGGVGGASSGFNLNSLFDSKGMGGTVLGGLQFGLGALNSWMGAKNQKFLQNYYGNQQAMQKADFANNAKMTNLRLDDRIATQLSNRGVTDPAQIASQKADYMSKWKVKETV